MLPVSSTLALDAAAKILSEHGMDLYKLIRQAQPTPDAPKYYKIRQVQEIFGIGRWTLSRLIRKGMISAVKSGPAKSAQVLVNGESVLRYLASHPAPTVAGV